MGLKGTKQLSLYSAQTSSKLSEHEQRKIKRMKAKGKGNLHQITGDQTGQGVKRTDSIKRKSKKCKSVASQAKKRKFAKSGEQQDILNY